MVLCRDLKLFTKAVVAIHGSKFKAANSRDRNFTPTKIDRRIDQIVETVHRCLGALEPADRTQPVEADVKATRLTQKIGPLRKRARELGELKERLQARDDPRVSTTDPDARSMTSDGWAADVVGYNLQAAVDTKHHLITAREVTNIGHDRGQLANMADQARSAIGKTKLDALADRGYLRLRPTCPSRWH